MSTLMESTSRRLDPEQLGPLAARAGITAADAAAVKRHAARVESMGDTRAALDAWRVAVKLTPGDARAWEGLSRCLHALGETGPAVAVARAADVLRGRS